MAQEPANELQALLNSSVVVSLHNRRNETRESFPSVLLSPSTVFQSPYPIMPIPNSVAPSGFGAFALHPFASLPRFSIASSHLQSDDAIALSAIAAAAHQQHQQQYSSAFRQVNLYGNQYSASDPDATASLSSLLSGRAAAGDVVWAQRPFVTLPATSKPPSADAFHSQSPKADPVTSDNTTASGPNDDLLQAVKNFFLPVAKMQHSPSTGEGSGAAEKTTIHLAGSPANNTLAGTAASTSSRESVTTTNSIVSEAAFDGTTVLCQVCGDKASGFHYGVHACEGCKGFFRRSIQQKIQYRPCTKNQQCSVLRINRNRCQYCRLKKCIAVGMSRDAVRFGRVPKREKAKILAEMQRANAQSQVSLISAELENEKRWISDIITAHMETCEFTRDKSLQLIHRYRQLGLPRPSSNVACPLNPMPVNGDSNQEELSEKYSPAIRGVVNFAKCIPGFNVLPQEDQVTLLKAGVFEVLLLRLTILFDIDTKSLIILNGSIYRRDGCASTSSSGNGSTNGSGQWQGRFLVDSLFDFVDRFNNLCLSDADIAMFCAVVLISPDRPGLRNPELVEKIHDRLKHALRNVLQIHHQTEPSLFGQLMLKIPDLRTLNTLHAEKLLAFKLEPQEKFRFGKESVESSVNGSCRSAESSSSAASSRSLRSPMSDASSCEAASAKNHKAKGLTGESSQWSTMCRASESKDGNSSNLSSTPPIAANATTARSLEPPHIQALNLSSSSSPYGVDSADTQHPTPQQQLVRVINWRTTKECPSLDSGKGSSSGGESNSDHAHSDYESKVQQTAVSDEGRKPRMEPDDVVKTTAVEEESEAKRSLDMPTLKRALLAPPLANLHSDPPNQGNGSVREKHMCVASLLEKQSLCNGAGGLMIPSDSLANRFGHTAANGVMGCNTQQQPINWALGTASNALAAQAFFLNNRAAALNQRAPTQLIQQHHSSTTPIQQLLNAAAAAAAVGNVTPTTPVLQSPLNYPPSKQSIGTATIQHAGHVIARRNPGQNGFDTDRFTSSPAHTSIRTSVLAQTLARDESISPSLPYTSAISGPTNCRSSPKRSLLDTSCLGVDDDQPLNLSKKRAVSSPNSEKTVVVGRPSVNVHSASGLSCR